MRKVPGREKCRAYQEAEEQAATRAVLNRERLTRKAEQTGDNKDLTKAMKARAG
ncbi:MAG: hypothetical protein ACYSUX_18315 [Planctomycetota bacterium]